MIRVDPSPILFYFYIFIRSEFVRVDPSWSCLLYTSDAADEEDSVDLGGRRIIKINKNKNKINLRNREFVGKETKWRVKVERYRLILFFFL